MAMMKDSKPYHDWLVQNARGEGFTGLGIGFADKTWLCVSLSETLEVPAMDKAMRCLCDAFAVIGLHRVPAAVQKWTFAKALIFCERRPDNAFIAIFTTNNDEVDPARIRQLVEAFKGFQPRAQIGP
jgi:hypothetical protein